MFSHAKRFKDMQITIEIDPQKLHIFLEQIKNIEGFLGLKTPIAEQLSASQKTLWAKIKTGLDEIKLSEQGKTVGVPLHELLKELKEA